MTVLNGNLLLYNADDILLITQSASKLKILLRACEKEQFF